MGKQVVLAIFKDEASADAAVANLKQLDKSDDDLSLKALGVLTLDENGTVVEHKVGKHVSGKGAAGGYVLGTIAVALTPGLGVGVLAWTAAGALVGHGLHKSLGLSERDLDRLHDEIWGGKAAVGVLVADVNVPLVLSRLEELGGVPESHPIDDELAAAQPDADDAVPPMEAATS